MDKKEIKTKVGDTVIRKDGLKGKVLFLCDCEECKERGFYEPFIEWENGELFYPTIHNVSKDFKNFYLIGHTVLGNKATEEELEERIADCDKEIEQWKKAKAQLRKQLWRLKEEMVEDWRERKALRELQKANKENKSTTDNQTED